MTEWGVSYVSIIDRIEEIRKDIEAACYQSALALALTLPDICGQVAHPEMVYKTGKNKEKRSAGKQYSTWFDENLKDDYMHPVLNEQNEIIDYRQYFTGKMCYLLRCSYLHSGDSSIGDFEESAVDAKEEFKYGYCFELSLDSECIGKIEDLAHKNERMELRINVRNLCRNLCDAAERYYYSMECNARFKEHGYRFICVTDFYTEFEKHNQRGLKEPD